MELKTDFATRFMLVGIAIMVFGIWLRLDPLRADAKSCRDFVKALSVYVEKDRAP